MFHLSTVKRYRTLLAALVVLAVARTDSGAASPRRPLARRSGAALCPRASFAVGRRVATNVEPFSIAVADFNRDGVVDFATGGLEFGGVAVFLGDGTGGFRAAGTALSGQQVISVAAGDFDGDGKIDVVASTVDGLTFLRGDGAGNLTAVLVPATAGVGTLAAGDFNGDGRLDVAAVTVLFGTVSVEVLLGDGAGHFTPVPPGAVVGANLTNLVIGDFDRDGHLDVVIGDNAGVHFLRGDGAGGLTSSATYPIAGGAFSIAAGDLDGDGRLDLAVTASNPSVATSLTLLLGGPGGFVPAAPVPTDTPRGHLVVADFDGDGHADVALVAMADLRLFRGDGAGHLTPSASRFVILDPAETVAAADVNGDGRPDLIIGGEVEESVLLGDGALGFDAPRIFPTGNAPGAMAFADFNSDGHLDAVTASYSTNEVSINLGDGAGHLGPPTHYPAGLGPLGVAVGDFNGDGKPDVAVANDDGSISLLAGDGRGHLAAFTTFPAGASPRGIVAGDWNHDGRLDLAVAAAGTSSVVILLGNGAGGFGAPVSFPAGGRPHAIVAGDFDGDGKLDLATANDLGPSYSVLLGRSDGSFGAAITGPATLYGGAFLDAGDFDGDGKLDLVMSNGLFTATVLLGLGDGHFTAAGDYDVGEIPDAVRVADVNGDGHLDFVVLDVDFTHFIVYTGDGSGHFAFAFSDGAGDTPSAVSLEDLDEDGRPDLEIAAAESGGVAVMRNTSFFVLPLTLPRASLGVRFSSALQVVGGAAPDHFTFSGALPPGLELDPATGILSGSPTQTGSFTFAVTGTDSQACAATRSYTVLVGFPVTVSLTATPAVVVAGQPLIVTARVMGPAGQGVPTGTVTFVIDGVAQTPVPLVGGVASLTVTGLLPGPHDIRAFYSGDGSFSSGSASLLQGSVSSPIPTLGTAGFALLALAIATIAVWKLRS